MAIHIKRADLKNISSLTYPETAIQLKQMYEPPTSGTLTISCSGTTTIYCDEKPIYLTHEMLQFEDTHKHFEDTHKHFEDKDNHLNKTRFWGKYCWIETDYKTTMTICSLHSPNNKAHGGRYTCQYNEHNWSNWVDAINT